MIHETPLLFPSEGHLLSGLLVSPDRPSAPCPVVITTGSWSTGSQTDFYDQPTQVDEAIELAVAHFQETLS